MQSEQSEFTEVKLIGLEADKVIPEFVTVFGNEARGEWLRELEDLEGVVVGASLAERAGLILKLLEKLFIIGREGAKLVELLLWPEVVRLLC